MPRRMGMWKKYGLQALAISLASAWVLAVKTPIRPISSGWRPGGGVRPLRPL